MINKQQITRILKQYNITFWTEGKNVSIDSVNINCPFCNDPSNHLGIFVDTGVFSCWRCNKSGPFVYLLKKLTGLSNEECERIVETGTTFKESAIEQIENITKVKQNFPNVKQSKIELPEFFKLITPDIDFPLLFHWLDLRNISIDTVIQYQCGICRAGKYMNRIIIPVFSNGDLVSYQARDLSEFADVRYRSAPGEINNYLYNYDCIDRRMIVVEGILDAWRLEEDVVASFGTSLTEQQKKLILDKKLDELIFVYDDNAYWKAKKQSKFFEPFVENIKVVKLPEGEDPDSLGMEETSKLIENSV